MKCQATRYKRHRFPAEFIQHAVWPYYRFNLSHPDIEDLLAQRGIVVTRESIRLWCNKFGPRYALRLRRAHRGYSDTFFIDEVVVRIRGEQRHLWRPVDQDGDVVDVLLQERRDAEPRRIDHESRLDLAQVAASDAGIETLDESFALNRLVAC